VRAIAYACVRTTWQEGNNVQLVQDCCLAGIIETYNDKLVLYNRYRDMEQDARY
jgi:hypothetical protein